jgi:hypothetical protein
MNDLPLVVVSALAAVAVILAFLILEDFLLRLQRFVLALQGNRRRKPRRSAPELSPPDVPCPVADTADARRAHAKWEVGARWPTITISTHDKNTHT